MVPSALLAALLATSTPEPPPDWTATRGAWETSGVATAHAADTMEAHAWETQAAIARGTPNGWPAGTATRTPEAMPTPAPTATRTATHSLTPGSHATATVTRPRPDLPATWTAAWRATATATMTPAPPRLFLPFGWKGRPRRGA